ncbi:MAG: hypothetical protein PHD32_09535 [Eubacteriales bacterium]|nr:hypothetical protein [Eubacteriales bacterium]
MNTRIFRIGSCMGVALMVGALGGCALFPTAYEFNDEAETRITLKGVSYALEGSPGAADPQGGWLLRAGEAACVGKLRYAENEKLFIQKNDTQQLVLTIREERSDVPNAMANSGRCYLRQNTALPAFGADTVDELGFVPTDGKESMVSDRELMGELLALRGQTGQTLDTLLSEGHLTHANSRPVGVVNFYRSELRSSGWYQDSDLYALPDGYYLETAGGDWILLTADLLQRVTGQTLPEAADYISQQS